MNDLDPNRAEPAKASSRDRSRQRFGIPPWIQARLDEEARVLTQRRGVPTLTKAETKRVLDTVKQRFDEDQAEQRLQSERTLPF